MASRVQRPKSNKFTSFQLPRIFVESTPMHQMQKARAQVLKSFTLKSHHKQLMLMGGEERNKKVGETPRTPRSRSTRFPSLRGEMDCCSNKFHICLNAFCLSFFWILFVIDVFGTAFSKYVRIYLLGNRLLQATLWSCFARSREY